jgi:hypothetical protein
MEHAEKGVIMSDEKVSIIIWFAKLIMPPKIHDPPEKQHSWRWRVAVMMWLFMLAGVIALLVAYGRLGVDGFARASDVTALKAQTTSELVAVNTLIVGVRSDVHDLRVQGISDQLFDANVKLCKASSEGDKEDWASRMKHLNMKYHGLTGGDYTPIACSQL